MVCALRIVAFRHLFGTADGGGRRLAKAHEFENKFE